MSLRECHGHNLLPHRTRLIEFVPRVTDLINGGHFPGSSNSYPFVDDTHESPNVPKPDPASRPDPVALAGDPSLNPDAKLLLGQSTFPSASS